MITPNEFAAFIGQHGLPKTEDIYHNSDSKVHSGHELDLEGAPDFNVWGCCRRPRNICNDRYRDYGLSTVLTHPSTTSLIC